MKTHEIRQQFLSFFQQHGHTGLPSASLVPANDPTLYFTNAGMVQFKDVFLGNDQRPFSRATTSQKCLRVSGKHNDLEEVGRTPRHHTLFEMLGNFSFGDYFKEKAILHAWKLLTEVFKLDKSRLWVTVYEEDDESELLWKKLTDVDPNKIQRLGAKDNFWSMGPTGPCGPCSEIHYDHGEAYGDCQKGPAGETDRYVEIWNLVFMQYDRDEKGTLTPLPKPSIDTGMGLERLAAIMQGVYSNYDTTEFQEIIQFVGSLAQVRYGQESETDVALCVIADHARATAHLIGDGVMPSNEGRGYVLRRIMRRAIRYGVRLNLKQAFLWKAANVVIKQMHEHYPNLKERQSFIEEVIRTEEERFSETLEKGLSLLQSTFAKHKEDTPLDGNLVFVLHDTYGFPMDLTRLIANEKGFTIDEQGFYQRMEVQRATARANWKGSGEAQISPVIRELAQQYETDFHGYTKHQTEATVVALLNAEQERVDTLQEQQTGTAIFDVSPCYAESGGQVGDCGSITGPNISAAITDTQKPFGNTFHHNIKVEQGEIKVGSTLQIAIDIQRRDNTKRNHTATHLLHAALQNVLGSHVHQEGSLVEPHRLRFDFSHHKALSASELQEIEDQIHTQILKNTALESRITSLAEAKSQGVTALFGEKYGEEVRVIDIPGYSTELCGGTHVERTGDIGLFVITSESGVAAGVRRIEALTGLGALQWQRSRNTAIKQAAKLLKSKPEKLSGAIEKLINDRKLLEKQLAKTQKELAKAAAGDLKSQAQEINGIKVIAAELNADINALREEADRLRDQLGTAVIVLGTRKKGVKLIAAVSKNIAGKSVHAGNIIRAIAQKIGGGGGGRPDMAQAGGKNPAGLPDALAEVYDLVREASL